MTLWAAALTVISCLIAGFIGAYLGGYLGASAPPIGHGVDLDDLDRPGGGVIVPEDERICELTIENPDGTTRTTRYRAVDVEGDWPA